MAVALPPLLVERLKGAGAVRLLMLLVVWGIATFLWGTFGAWAQKQYWQREQQLAEPYAATLQTWLQAKATVLDKLAQDPRLAAGISLPAGAESLPIQRVLYEFSYLNHLPDVYALDLLRGKSGHTAGATPLPDDLVDRLTRLPHDANLMAAALGQDNGEILLIRAAKAPLPQRLFVAVPLMLTDIAGTLPTPPEALTQGRSLALAVVHPQGWAHWDMNTPALDFPPDVAQALDHQQPVAEGGDSQTLLVPLGSIPGLYLSVSKPVTVVSPALLPRMLVLLWALVMSALILASDEALRQLIRAKTAPLAGQAASVAAPLTSKLAPLAEVAETGVGVVGSILGKLAAFLPLGALKRALREATEQDAPLLEVGGMEGGFRSPPAARLTPRRAPAQRAVALPEAFTTAAVESAGLNKVERRTRGRGSAIMSGQTPTSAQPPHLRQETAAWTQATFQPAAALPKKNPSVLADAADTPADPDDLLDVVRDCLRKKRIKLLYQPIYRAEDNMPVMHEVFARLVRADGKELTPAEFLPVAIKHKMTLELDVTVLRRVVYEHFGGGAEPATPLAVNISSTSLDGIAYLQEMASQGPRVLRKMSFEVRSQEMIRDPKALKLLKELQKHGGNLAVDYFGGGTAMLDASKRMGFNYVKMDSQKFATSDEGKKQFIKLAQHATSIGLPMIFEKVGHRDVEDFGRRVGVPFLQGYALKSPQESMAAMPLAPDVTQFAALAGEPL